MRISLYTSLLSLVTTTIATHLQTCFFNLAYEEHNYIDEPTYTLNTARNCYVLIDTSNFDNYTSVVYYGNKLKSYNNTIGCYMSVGTVEKWRKDFKDFIPGVDYSKKMWNEWPGEYFILGDKNGNPTVNTISLMKKRIDNFSMAGCDYIEMDNMDINTGNKYTNIKSNGMRKYNKILCDYIHTKNMKCMAKNTGPSDPDDYLFDGLTVESYKNMKNWWGEKHTLNFTLNSKLFMISHYNQPTVDSCMKVWIEYKKKYNSTFGFACSQFETKHYIHFEAL